MSLELYRLIRNTKFTLKLSEAETEMLIMDLVDKEETGYNMPIASQYSLKKIAYKATIFHDDTGNTISLQCKGGSLSLATVNHLNNAFNGYLYG